MELSSEQKSAISGAYERAIADVGDEEIQYVAARAERVFRRLRFERGGWLGKLADTSERLHELLLREETKPGLLGERAKTRYSQRCSISAILST